MAPKLLWSSQKGGESIKPVTGDDKVFKTFFLAPSHLIIVTFLQDDDIILSFVEVEKG